MPTLRANGDDLMHVGLDEVLFRRWAEKNLIYQQIFDVRGSTRKYEKTTGFSVFSNLAEKEEGTDMSYDDPIQGYDTTFTHKSYGLYFRVTKEMEDDDLYDVIRRMPAALADSTARTKETYAAWVFNNGFAQTATTYMSGGDGKYLLATDHPLTGGGTYQNILTTAADLSVTSLEEALYTMRLTKGDRGELLVLEPKTLLVPPHLERTAFELTKSSGRPDTANRADNWLATQGLNVVVWPYLTDTDAWFLLTDTSQHALVCYNRQDLETDYDRDFKSKDHLYSVFSRWSYGWMDWRGVFGSPGA